MFGTNPFRKNNDPLVSSIKKVLSDSENTRKIEESLNAELKIHSRSHLPHDQQIKYDVMIENRKQNIKNPTTSLNEEMSDSMKKKMAMQNNSSSEDTDEDNKEPDNDKDDKDNKKKKLNEAITKVRNRKPCDNISENIKSKYSRIIDAVSSNINQNKKNS